MANSFLTYTNDVLAKLNEVQLTSTDFGDARGIQIQAKNAVNQAIRYINQREFCWPFNAAEESKTLTAGVVKYSLPSNTKHIDYSTFRIRKSETFGNEARHLSLMDYKEYLHYFIRQEDDTVTTTLSSGIDDDDTTIPVSQEQLLLALKILPILVQVLQPLLELLGVQKVQLQLVILLALL